MGEFKKIEINKLWGWEITGIVLLKDVQLQDGIIEYDFIATDSLTRSAEVIFRADSKNDYEKIFCRLKNSGLKEATQYMPIIGGTGPWRLYKQEQGKAVFHEGWNHLKLILKGFTAILFINNSDHPALLVNYMRNENKSGMIGIRAVGKGLVVSNFRYAKLPISALNEKHESLSDGIATRWEILQLGSLQLEKPLEHFIWPPAENGIIKQQSEELKTEIDGLLNLIRYRSRFSANLAFNTVAARLIINSERDVERILKFGFCKRVQIFLNGKSIFWQELASRDEQVAKSQGSTDGAVRLTRDNEINLPLKKGKNELVFVSEGEGYGIYVNWGLYAEFVVMNGLQWIN